MDAGGVVDGVGAGHHHGQRAGLRYLGQLHPQREGVSVPQLGAARHGRAHRQAGGEAWGRGR